MRTGPAAKDSTESNRKQGNKHNKDEHAQTKNKKVLRPEDHSKKNELPLQDIKHKERVTAKLNEWQGEKHYQIQVT